ncbi:hypothetical protein DYB32_000828 [Aphanomyces invadans]|uniref:Uncharacterized protein n=1 Tax=Aphanomyces invadans TaxID=157072 RepID=A0A418B8U8_9STRA|nr:hypothetical protein DYB32_000828 [Aphanomyces invadans]
MQGCLRRHFKAHRDHCIKVYLKEESESESDEEEEEEEEEEDEEKTNDLLNRRKSGRGSVLMRGSSQAFHNSGMLIPGLTEEQIAQLVKLSSKSTDVLKSSKEISSLKAQLEEMMKSQVNMQELAGRMSTMQLAQPVSSQVLQKSSSLKQKELEKLMQKLEALEKRANFASAAVPPASSSMMPMSMPSMMMAPPPPLPPQVVVYTPLLVKDDDKFKKYFKLLKMAMPVDQIKAKMEVEGVSPALLDTPNAVSPNDPGRKLRYTSRKPDANYQGAAGGGGGGGMRSPSHPDEGSSPVPVRSVKDQMAAELAAASDAVHDIFGEDTVKASGGGMTMVEQLEKKARKESNKKLVDNIDAINATIHDLLTMQFKSEANKDTRDWYFSEQQRLDAGNAYLRLWSLSTLANDASQMIQKYDQIVNAPVVLAAQTKNKVEVIDKFTNLLKDAVSDQLIDAAAILATAALDFADEELRVLEKTVRAKKIRGTRAISASDPDVRDVASTTVHVGEKAVQLVGIVNKLGARGMDAVNTRVGPLEAQLKAIKDEFFADKDEEEEDDVL